MKTLIIVNEPPYGSECCFDALRLANALLNADDENDVTVFLMADAVGAARTGQKTSNGTFSIEKLLQVIMHSDAKVLLCTSCMDTRGIDDDAVVAGARRSNMEELAGETMSADKVLVF